MTVNRDFSFTFDQQPLLQPTVGKPAAACPVTLVSLSTWPNGEKEPIKY
jgi:hypothetical protein